MAQRRPWAFHPLPSWSTFVWSKRISMQQRTHLVVSPTSPLIMSQAGTGVSLIYLDTHIASPVSKPWLATCALLSVPGNKAASPGCRTVATSHGSKTERFCLISFEAHFSSIHSLTPARGSYFRPLCHQISHGSVCTWNGPAQKWGAWWLGEREDSRSLGSFQDQSTFPASFPFPYAFSSLSEALTPPSHLIKTNLLCGN